MKKPNNALGQFEHLVLTAVAVLGDEAYGLAIQAEVEEFYSGTEVNLGSVYVTLERLELKGYVKSRYTESRSQQDGRSRRGFSLLKAGELALKESINIQLRSHSRLARKLKWKPIM